MTINYRHTLNTGGGQCKNYMVAKPQMCFFYMIQVIRIAMFQKSAGKHSMGVIFPKLK